jgi:hypothetical protein
VITTSLSRTPTAIRYRPPVAASTRRGEKGLRDEAITPDGPHLYALDADAGVIHGWTIGADGALTPAGTAGGLPLTAAGLATL